MSITTMMIGAPTMLDADHVSNSSKDAARGSRLKHELEPKLEPLHPVLPTIATSSNSHSLKLEPLDDEAASGRIVAPPVVVSSSVPNSTVSSSSSFSSGPPNSSAVSSYRRGWKVGDWCWLNSIAPVLEAEESTLSQLDPADEFSPASSEQQACRLRRSCRQAKRKAAGAISSPINDHDEDYDSELATDYSSDTSEAEPTEKRGEFQKHCDDKWEEMLQLFLEYKKEHGDTVFGDYRLTSWVTTQRTLYRKERLAQSRILRLNSIEFIWNPTGSRFKNRWEEMFQFLLEYKKEHGNTLVPKRCGGNDKQLGIWVNNQRRRKEQLGQSRVLRLNSIGFVWNPIENRLRRWEEMFQLLLEYKKEHGDTVVPKIHGSTNNQLAHWVATQRVLCGKERLAKSYVLRLNAIGFVWGVRRNMWEEMFQLLLEYKKEHGHTAVPYKPGRNDNQLANWVSNTRGRKERLSQSRILRLDSIGFVWKPHLDRWEEMFQLLLEYQKKHGDTLVSAYSKKHHQLGKWVCAQHLSMRNNKLPKDRIARLQSIGFVFDGVHKSSGNEET